MDDLSSSKHIQRLWKWSVGMIVVLAIIIKSAFLSSSHEHKVVEIVDQVCRIAQGSETLESPLLIRVCNEHHELHQPELWLQWLLGSLLPRIIAASSLAGFGYFMHLLYNDKLPSIISDPLARFVHGAPVQQSSPTALSEIISYRIDLWLSSYSYSKGVALLGLTASLVILGWLAVYCVSPATLHDALWVSIAGSGLNWTFTESIGEGLILRIVGLLVAVGGMLITALLINLVSGTISDKVDEMKKGRSAVLESGHTLILGWSEKLFCLLEQLCMANESGGGAAIVILAEMAKEAMEDALLTQNIERRGSTIICRSGDAMMAADLLKVSVCDARSIIVLANHQAPEQSDSHVVRIVLSLTALNKSGHKLTGHVVAELCHRDNVDLVNLLGDRMVSTVVTDEMIGRLMLQCARQAGLGNVLQQLLGYEGNEFYLKNWPELTGRRFGDVVISFADAIPIGVKCNSTKKITLNPGDDYIFQEKDELLVLAEDDDAYEPGKPFDISDAGHCPSDYKHPCMAGRFLMIGWRRDMHDMIRVFDSFANPGSEIVLFSEKPLKDRRTFLLEHDFDPDEDLVNCRLVFEEPHTYGSPVVMKKLATLNPLQCSAILIFGDESATEDNVGDADSRNLATMLQLRHIQLEALMEESEPTKPHDKVGNNGKLEKRSSSRAMKLNVSQKALSINWLQDVQLAVKRTIVVSEILDSKTRQLISCMEISEYVMSNELVSMLLAMISECRELMEVFLELFQDSEGNELYIYPARRYIAPGETINFYQLTKRARCLQEIPLGYRRHGVVTPELNPGNKSAATLSLDTIASVIILASDFNATVKETEGGQNAASVTVL